MPDLLNTLASPGEFDALTTLRPDEPYFLLVGRDSFAPRLVGLWARMNRRRALREADDGKLDGAARDTELRKSTQAEEIAWGMTAYKKGHEAVPEGGPRASYTGFEVPEATASRDKRIRQTALAVSALHNAVAEVNSLVELLTAEDDEVSDFMSDVLADMRGLAAELTPKRPIIDAPHPPPPPEEKKDDA